MSLDEPRPSVAGSSSTSNSGRPQSSVSHTLPPLPPSTDSLVSGTSIPAPTPTPPPPPPPPPKDPSAMSIPSPMPVTPQRKPVLRQKSPLSNEAYFSSPSSTMPGAFPTSPTATSPSATSPGAARPDTSFTTHVYASSPSPSPDSKTPKRPGNLRNLLSFKAMRRSYSNSSPDSPGFRPQSRGAESVVSGSQPSLSKKRSGSFWRRKSSMGMSFIAGEDTGSRPSTPKTNGQTTLDEGESARSPTPGPGSDLPTITKRQSGTFWRRRSSIGLATAFGANGGTGVAQNGGANGVSVVQNEINGHSQDVKLNGIDGQENEKPLPTLNLVPSRTYSPPPQLPEFIGAGTGLGGEDLFKDIH